MEVTTEHIPIYGGVPGGMWMCELRQKMNLLSLKIYIALIQPIRL